VNQVALWLQNDEIPNSSNSKNILDFNGNHIGILSLNAGLNTPEEDDEKEKT